MQGIVYLVGVGPGDPGLITIKAIEKIKGSDVLVYDYLANKKFLEYAKDGAEVIYVGKRGGCHTLPQDEINEVLIQKAREGKVVARVKGGDPFIFGRGGEEAMVLVENNVPFEIIPGISSAYSVPAYAGIPVTFRGVTSTVAFITGHEDPTKDGTDIDWEKISTGAGTLVFLMGVHNLAKIVHQLIRYGRRETTPVALIRWGTLPRQEILTGTLANIVDKVEQENFKPPAIIIVGDVIKLREKLKWFETKPLFGKRILVTRSRSQASDLVELLEKNGAEPIEFPTIKIVPPDDFAPLDSAIANLETYDWAVFTSVNGVDYFFERLKASGKDLRELKGVRIAAIGPATAKRVESLNLLVDYVPDEYRGEAVVEGFKKAGVSGLKILIPRAEVAREVLPDQLREMGATVDVAVAYKTVTDESKSDEIKSLLAKGKVDVITFTSSSTAKNFVKSLKGSDLEKLLENVAIACIGPITAETTRNLGLKVDIEAKEYTIPGLVEAICQDSRRRTQDSKAGKFL